MLNAPPQIITESHATVNASSWMPICGSAKKYMKIWTRIGVFRITSTYTAASWLITGIRCARAAPSTLPITTAPTIAIADTSSVRCKPSSSASLFSRRNSIGSKTTKSIRG